VQICRKYKRKYLKNKQKSRKNAFFVEKKGVNACFSAEKQIFFVILRLQSVNREIV
jgi:hypothetical protein